MPAPPRAKPIEDELDPLPPADGDEAEPHENEAPIELDVDERPQNLLDDATGEGDPIEPIEVGGEERGWLDNASAADDVDVGGHDFEPEDASLLRDVDEPGVGEEDFGLDDSSVALDDAGEEGFDADDDELREEDLPRMDADAEADGTDDLARFWGGNEPEVTLPPWDDRAWERIAHVPAVGTVRTLVASGGKVTACGVATWRIALESDGKIAFEAFEDDAAKAPAPELVATGSSVYSIRAGRLCRADGERWHPVEGIGGLTAITAADGGLLVAMHSEKEDRAWIARMVDDENARVVAELGGEDEDSEPKVQCIAWDAERKIAWVGGAFGVIAFRQSGMRPSGGALKGE